MDEIATEPLKYAEQLPVAQIIHQVHHSIFFHSYLLQECKNFSLWGVGKHWVDIE